MVPALPKPELPQAALTIAAAPLSKTDSISVLTESATTVGCPKSPRLAAQKNVRVNPLTAIVMGKTAILTRQHKQRIRIKYSNLRNAKPNNVLNEHNVRSPPPRKKETIKKSENIVATNSELIDENLKDDKKHSFGPFESVNYTEETNNAKLDNRNGFESPKSHDSMESGSSSTLSSVSSIVRKRARKRVRKIAITKNTKLLHRDSKERDRPFSCRHCGKLYRWKSTLRRHENDECGNKEPSYQCPYCPYKAKQRGNLGVHVRKHHANMPQLESRRKRKSKE